MKYERKFVNISAFRRAALLSVSRRDTARSVAILRGRKDALLSDAKVRKHSKQNKLFADFRQDYMRHGSLFATNSRNRPQNCRIVTAMLAVGTGTWGIAAVIPKYLSLRLLYLAVLIANKLTAKPQVGVDYRGQNRVKSVQNEKYSAKSADFLRFLLYLCHVIDDFACLDLQH